MASREAVIRYNLKLGWRCKGPTVKRRWAHEITLYRLFDLEGQPTLPGFAVKRMHWRLRSYLWFALSH